MNQPKNGAALAEEMLRAANTIEQVNTVYNMPADAYWRPSTLRKESEHVAGEADSGE